MEPPSTREKGGEEGGGRGSRRPPNHVVSDLVGHSTNVVSDVALRRVLATIGDESLRS
ncbi:hypothetical protein TIFTF001_028682 [Ficus carica]|uniref:Uncharacterized protein n=1 Tax=Ficus carica TaxID=3494 RepID=A0AA88DQH9_FICCA|nr:hypothetical protein TIFTF001_028682 [Ficus carica]